MSAYGRAANCDKQIAQGLGIDYNNSKF